MAKLESNITESNLMEWLHSLGYLLPRNEVELIRFEKLNKEVIRSVKDESVNPFAILNGTWQPTAIEPLLNSTLTEDINELKMAARKSDGIPNHILDKIKRNQNKNGGSDNSES